MSTNAVFKITLLGVNGPEVWIKSWCGVQYFRNKRLQFPKRTIGCHTWDYKCEDICPIDADPGAIKVQ